MMRALYSGVSGLKTHQVKMDVIGNNIANVNTVAFKSSTTTFSEIMYQTTSMASGASALTGRGGVNAKQVGLGVMTGSTSINISSPGATQTTGDKFDLKITGDSFFVVNNGSSNLFTKAGSFYIDGAGNLAMKSTGYNVMGWQVDETTGQIRKDVVSPLRILQEKNLTSPPEATTKSTVSGILDINDSNLTSDSGLALNMNFYDALGYQYSAKFAVKSTGTDGKYTVSLSDVIDSGTNRTILGGAGKEAKDIFGTTHSAGGSVKVKSAFDIDKTSSAPLYEITGSNPLRTFNPNTDLKSQGFTDDEIKQYFNVPSDVDLSTATWDDVNDELVFAGTQTYVELSYDPTTGAFDFVGSAGDLSTMLNMSTIDGKFSNIDVDFSTTSNYNNGGTSTMGTEMGGTDTYRSGAGKKLGALIDIQVDGQGMIWGAYDNGNTTVLGQIAVATFANASGLEKVGENCYNTTLNSGNFDGVGQSVDADGGSMSSGVLEMSNVDLSSEFTEMITTQRGFQANSRIITTSDSLLEELINLKR